MRFLILCVLAFLACADELLLTKEYVAALKQQAVTWEVEDYESNVFRGWTLEEAKNFLGKLDNEQTYLPEHVPSTDIPKSISWAGSNCDHEPRNQGDCGSCWAFAATGMLSDRCCIMVQDHGWLAPQELVSCERSSHGCSGGYMSSPINYMESHGGLVPEACYPYQAKDLSCPSKCVDGKDWKSSHICKCKGRSCSSINSMKSCLKTGPVTYAFDVCRSFFAYKTGIYHCDCNGNYLGGHAVLAVGYSETPECHFITKNSWSNVWGDKGYFKMACNTCDLSGGAMCETVS